MTDTAALDAWLAEYLLDGRMCTQCTTGRNSWSGKHWHIAGGITSSLKLSTTGDGMLMVMEAMQKRGYQGRVSAWSRELWSAIFYHGFRLVLEPTQPFDAETGPLAVALAAEAALLSDA